MINNEQASSNYKLRFLDDLGNSYPDWKKDKLKNNVVKIKGGGTPFIGNKDFYFNGKIPFAKINDLTSQEKYVISTNINITEDGLNNSSSWIIPKNSILYSIYASIGFTAINKIKLATNQAILGIIPNENKLVLSYLYYYLIFYKKQILKYIDLGVQSNLNLQNVKNISLSLPSLDEQQKIGSFLSEIDNYISLQQKEITLTKGYKKSLLKQIFNQELKFVDENGNNYSEWKENKIKDIFVVTRGSVLAKDKLSKDKTDNYLFPVYSSQTLNNGLLGYYNQYLFEDAITWTTDGANAGDFNFRQGKFYATNVCGILKSNEGYANTFMASLLKKEAKKYVIKLGNSKLMNNVVADISIFSPCIVEQQKIGTLLNNLDQQINQLKLEYKNLNEYKNILLNKLIF